MSAPTSHVEALAKLVVEHELLSGSTALRRKRRFVGTFVCRCGHFEQEVEDVGYQDLHARHVAAVLLEAGWRAS